MRFRAVVMLLLIPLFASGLALLSGCNTGIAEREAEARLRRRLPDLIGPAAQYRVNVRASDDLSVMDGRMREITIEGTTVRVGNQYPVDELLVVLEKVRVDLKRQTLEEVGAARFQVLIRPATLIQYLENDPDNVREVSILLDHGRMTVAGRYRLMRVWTSFRVSGTLELLDSRRISFRTSTARASGLPVPEAIIHYLDERLNPVLDVTGAALPLELKAVLIRPDGVMISGSPKLDDPSLLTAPPPAR